MVQRSRSPYFRLRTLARCLGILYFAGGSGCAVYHPMPLPAPGSDAAISPSDRAVRVAASSFKHPILRPVAFSDSDDGFSPEQAAIFAVLANPTLRAARDAKGLAQAQIIEAGILPNPQLTASWDLAEGNAVPGVKNAYGLSGSWEVTALFARAAKLEAARAHAASVDLSIAWQEWQTAEAAKLAVYQLVSVRAQAALARQVEEDLTRGAGLLRDAVARHEKTELDLAPALAAAEQAKADRLLLEQQEADERLTLNQTMGLPPSARVHLRAKIMAPSDEEVARMASLASGSQFENQRLDLVALRLGYQSQEATVRANIRTQFPKIVLGITRASDNANLKSLGPNAQIDLPIFDRNQGNIAVETATRQQLYDEFNARVYDARAEIAKALADLHFIQQRLDASTEALTPLERVANSFNRALGSGGVDVIVAFGARQSFFAKQLEVERLKEDFIGSIISLELATGTPLLPAKD